MQLLTLASLFVAAAFAVPRANGPFAAQATGVAHGVNPFANPFSLQYPCQDGDENGCYASMCWCTLNGRYDFFATQLVADDLGSQYPNLRLSRGGGIIDTNGRGVEANGVSAACNRVTGNQQFITRVRVIHFGSAPGSFYTYGYQWPQWVDANCAT